MTGGGYAEYCKAPALQCLPLPRGFSFVEAAALPEVLFTTWNSMVWLGRLAETESVVIQGGTSGVGLAAIQIAKQLYGATVFTTSGSEEKLEVCRSYGADHAISYPQHPVEDSEGRWRKRDRDRARRRLQAGPLRGFVVTGRSESAVSGELNHRAKSAFRR